jgi:hypothetical protein
LASIFLLSNLNKPTTSVSITPVFQKSEVAIPTLPLNSEIKFPILVSQTHFQIQFSIDNIQRDTNSLTFFVTISRTGSGTLEWHSDRENLDQIFLVSNDVIYPAVDVNGIFNDEVTILKPGETYQGWIKFDVPREKTFSFNYPNMDSVHIQLP